VFDFAAVNPGHVPGMGEGGTFSLLAEISVMAAPVLFLTVAKSMMFC
jgi:hypothetical protein